MSYQPSSTLGTHPSFKRLKKDPSGAFARHLSFEPDPDPARQSFVGVPVVLVGVHAVIPDVPFVEHRESAQKATAPPSTGVKHDTVAG